VQTLNRVIAGVEPTAISVSARTFDEAVGELLYPRRVAAAVLGLAGTIGLMLASAGLYGLISFSVAQRFREIGVRMALGADGADIRRMILREGLKIAATGAVLGFTLSYAAIRLTSRYVVPMPSGDALTFLAVPLLLGTVILLACYLPAARAGRVDPIKVLRAL
jgi:ABC-type antimicrobial peptide transport system permease subunit